MKSIALARSLLGIRSAASSMVARLSSTDSNTNGHQHHKDSYQKTGRYEEDDDDFSYRVSYDSIAHADHVDSDNRTLSNPYIRMAESETITGNVKNVQGWRGGAERGFSAIYPDVIHTLTQEGMTKNNELRLWYTKVLSHNLSRDVIGRRYGILVPISYRHLKKNASKDEMNMAHILGWGVECLRASNVLTQEIMGLKKSSNEQKLWWVRQNIDPIKAFNDAQLLQNGYHILLQNHFYKDPNYHFYMDAFAFAIRSITIGRLLQFDNHPLQKPDYEGYTIQTYKALVRHNLSSINYILPVSLAMHLAGINDSKVQEKSREIFEQLGYFARVNRDYAKHFLSNDHRDVRLGKITWLNVIARQRLEPEDRARLDKNYGKDDDAAVQEVINIYHRLKMHKSILKQLEETRSEIENSIQQISKIDRYGFSPQFVFNLMESMDQNQIS